MSEPSATPVSAPAMAAPGAPAAMTPDSAAALLQALSGRIDSIEAHLTQTSAEHTNFHQQTQRSDGADAHFHTHFQPLDSGDGFLFQPASDRRLRATAMSEGVIGLEFTGAQETADCSCQLSNAIKARFASEKRERAKIGRAHV